MDNIFLNKNVALYINFDTKNEYEKNKEKIKNAMSKFCSSYNIKQYKEYIDIGFIGKNVRRSRYDTLIRNIDNLGINAVVVYNLSQLARYPVRLNKVINTLYSKKVIIYSLEDKQSLVTFNEEELKKFKAFGNKYLIDIISKEQKKLQKDIYNKKHNLEFDIDKYNIKEYRKHSVLMRQFNNSIESEK